VKDSYRRGGESWEEERERTVRANGGIENGQVGKVGREGRRRGRAGRVRGGGIGKRSVRGGSEGGGEQGEVEGRAGGEEVRGERQGGRKE